MFESGADYLKFLRDPKYYIEHPLRFKEMRFEGKLKRYYPIVWCDDILLHFNHYLTFEQANGAWERRKKRIDWDNLFVMFYNDDVDMIEQFLELSYEKRVCFTSACFKNENVVTIDYRNDNMTKQFELWQFVNGMATLYGRFLYYNVFDLILYGRITPVAKYHDLIVG